LIYQKYNHLLLLTYFSIKIIQFIKESMPSINSLSLNCTYSKNNYQTITLEQIRILCLPQYGKSESKDQFNWFRLFPLIKRLIAPINSKSPIQFLIYQFKNIISGFFPIDTYYMNKQIKITSQWLEKHLYRSRGENIKNFIFTFFMD
jgi:hypothetical protein